MVLTKYIIGTVPVTAGSPLSILMIPVFIFLLMIFSSQVLAYEDYSGCADCHGGFKGDNYTSLQDGTNWGSDLMDGHQPFISNVSNDTCDACHKSGAKGEVYLNFSQDSTLSKSCVGCHGRDEDVTGNCTGEGTGLEVECGSGAGLRQMHALNVPASDCGGCHSSDPTPIGEQTAPFNYGLGSIVMQDSCDGDGTESQFGATGLDNDGDGQRDGNDSDCLSNSPPTQPGTLSASAITTNSATVSWGASSDSDGDTITYLVEYRRNGDVPWTSAGTTTTTSRPLSGLDASQSYDVQVTPNDTTDDGPIRTTLNLFTTETPPNTPPTQPGTLSASAVTINSATVSWGASTDSDGDTITYLVEYRRNGDVPWTSAGTTTTTSRPLSGLDAEQAYDVRVTPNDTTEDGPIRTTLNLFTTETPPNTPPTQPGTLSASAVTINSATVSWSASTDDDGDTITYLVEYRRNGDPSWISAGTTSTTSRPLSGLDASQSYDVRVTPNDTTEDGPIRTTLNLFTTETPNTPPTQPGALSASAVTINSATVSWGASTDVDDGDTITYLVDYRRNGDTTWISSGSTTDLSQPLSGLDSSQAYDVRVTPNDGSDDGPDRTALNLFQTEVDTDLIFKDSFEGN